MPRATLLAIILLALFSAACRVEEPPKQSGSSSAPSTKVPASSDRCSGVRWLFDIEPSPGVVLGADFDGAQKQAATWEPPAALVVTIEPPLVKPGQIEIVAVLSNTGSEPIEAFTLAGGDPAGTNPWNARLAVAERPMEENGPPRPREIYPYAERVTLPPGATVRYVLAICLAAYEVKAGAKADIAYSFELWGKNRRTGTLSVEIPREVLLPGNSPAQ